MSQLNLNLPINDTIKENRRRVASGDITDLLQKCHKSGLTYTAIGGILFIPVIVFLYMTRETAKPTEIILLLLLLVLLLWSLIYGIICLLNPRKNIYYNYYLNTLEFIKRNTGYPDKPYVPEEWEIPLTEYSEAALANILNLVGGWGENNTFFICNHITQRKRVFTIRHAYIFNICEKGLFLIPLSNDNGVCKAYPDIGAMVPLEKMNKIFVHPSNVILKDGIIFTIYTDLKNWTLSALGDTHRYQVAPTFCVFKNIDGVAFHEYNVKKLYQTYRSYNFSSQKKSENNG